jgi:hypothetical protein
MVHTPGNPSALHPTMRMTYKRVQKIERIARLTLDPSGFTNAQIANMLGCHVQTIVIIRQMPEFHAKVVELQSGVLSHYDQTLRSNLDTSRQELKDMLPLALNVIKNAAMGKYGSALAYKAAADIMDREGNLAKVSKTTVSLENIPNMSIDPLIASNLMALLGTAPKRLETIEAQITPDNPFTQNASVAESTQFELSELNTEEMLDKLDAANATAQ